MFCYRYQSYHMWRLGGGLHAAKIPPHCTASPHFLPSCIASPVRATLAPFMPTVYKAQFSFPILIVGFGLILIFSKLLYGKKKNWYLSRRVGEDAFGAGGGFRRGAGGMQTQRSSLCPAKCLSCSVPHHDSTVGIIPAVSPARSDCVCQSCGSGTVSSRIELLVEWLQRTA